MKMKKDNNLYRLYDIVKEHRWSYLFSTIGVASRNFGITFFNAFFASQIVQMVVKGELSEMLHSVLLLFGILILFCCLDSFFQYWHSTTTHKVNMSLRHRLYERIIKSDMYSLGKYSDKSELFSRMNSDSDLVFALLRYQILTPLMFLISGLGATISLFRMKGGLAIVIFSYGLGALIALTQKQIAKKMVSLQEEVQEARKTLIARFIESVDRSSVIRLCGYDFYIKNDFQKKSEVYRNKCNQSGKYAALNSVLNLCPAFIQYTGGMIIGVYLCAQGWFTIADIVYITPLIALIFTMILSLGNTWISVEKSMVGLNRVYDILSISNEDMNPNGIQEASFDKTCFQAQNLSFSYKEGNKILDNVSFSIQHNEIVALTGPSGCGKSTLLKIIMGLYPYNGSCSVFDQEVREYNRDYLRKIIAYVPQTDIIVDGTIRDNLLLGSDSTYIDIEIEKILDEIGAMDWIQQYGGLSAPLSESGRNLSGGQTQSIAIARALLRNSQFIILDETLSALDSDTKIRLLRKLKNRKDTSVLIVTHDQALIQICDRTIRFDMLPSK